MGSTFDVGDVIRTTAKFSTSTASTDYTDPSSVTFQYDTPTSAAPSTDVVIPPTTIGDNSIIHRSSTGEFYADITATGQGLYEYRWTSTGTLATSQEGWFSVRSRRVT